MALQTPIRTLRRALARTRHFGKTASGPAETRTLLSLSAAGDAAADAGRRCLDCLDEDIRQELASLSWGSAPAR